MIKRFKDIKKHRLKNWNYANNGFYFITISTYKKIKYFGKIKNNEMKLNWRGKIVMENWENIIKNYNNIKLHNFVIMPNHIHGIIQIDNNYEDDLKCVKISNISPLNKNSISSIINHFKGATTKQINKIEPNNFKWQSLFHDHIIRNEKDYINHVIYIENNVKDYKE